MLLGEGVVIRFCDNNNFSFGCSSIFRNGISLLMKSDAEFLLTFEVQKLGPQESVGLLPF